MSWYCGSLTDYTHKWGKNLACCLLWGYRPGIHLGIGPLQFERPLHRRVLDGCPSLLVTVAELLTGCAGSHSNVPCALKLAGTTVWPCPFSEARLLSLRSLMGLCRASSSSRKEQASASLSSPLSTRGTTTAATSQPCTKPTSCESREAAAGWPASRRGWSSRDLVSSWFSESQNLGKNCTDQSGISSFGTSLGR